MSLQPEAVAYHTDKSGSSYFFNAGGVIATLSKTVAALGFPASITTSTAESFGSGGTGGNQTFRVPKAGVYAVTLTVQSGAFAGGTAPTLAFFVYGTKAGGSVETSPSHILTVQQFETVVNKSYTYFVNIADPAKTFTVNLQLTLGSGDTVTTNGPSNISAQIVAIA